MDDVPLPLRAVLPAPRTAVEIVRTLSRIVAAA
jgi:hypothetical protein